jgi:hypothetical protein
MANVKISAAADAGTLLSSDMLPLARSGDTNAYHATMAEISTFTSTSVASGAYGNVGRSYIHNGLMNVAQRGAGPWTANSYTADRWAAYTNLDTIDFAVSNLPPGGISGIDEAARFFLQNNFTGNAGAAALNIISQLIEGVARLSSKTVTLSFYAFAGTAGMRLGANFAQGFGSGGSPSASVSVAGQSVALTTGWARYSLTFTIPSIAGKTLGTNNNDSTSLQLWYSSGTTNAVNSGAVGVQSGVIGIWGVQLEVGSTATPLEKPDPQQDLAKCQRFYCTGTIMDSDYQPAGSGVRASFSLPVTMRATPTVTPTDLGSTNISGLSFAMATARDGYRYGSATATGTVLLYSSYAASADL